MSAKSTRSSLDRAVCTTDTRRASLGGPSRWLRKGCARNALGACAPQRMSSRPCRHQINEECATLAPTPNRGAERGSRAPPDSSAPPPDDGGGRIPATSPTRLAQVGPRLHLDWRTPEGDACDMAADGRQARGRADGLAAGGRTAEKRAAGVVSKRSGQAVGGRSLAPAPRSHGDPEVVRGTAGCLPATAAKQYAAPLSTPWLFIVAVMRATVICFAALGAIVTLGPFFSESKSFSNVSLPLEGSGAGVSTNCERRGNFASGEPLRAGAGVVGLARVWGPSRIGRPVRHALHTHDASASLGSPDATPRRLNSAAESNPTPGVGHRSKDNAHHERATRPAAGARATITHAINRHVASPM